MQNISQYTLKKLKKFRVQGKLVRKFLVMNFDRQFSFDSSFTKKTGTELFALESVSNFVNHKQPKTFKKLFIERKC